MFEFDAASIAKDLAPDYLAAIRDRGYPLPSEFDNPPNYESWTEEEEADACREFVAMINHWRETVIGSLEQQRKAPATDRHEQ